jgi:hypothetical protein
MLAVTVVSGIVQVPGNHEQLPELLLESHPAEQIADAIGHWQIGSLIRHRTARLRDCQRRRNKEAGREKCGDKDAHLRATTLA